MAVSYLIFVLAVALTIFSTEAASTNPKKRSTCRQTSILQNVNTTQLLGHWYQYSRGHHDFEEGCDCFTSEVTDVDSKLQTVNCCQMTKVSNDTQTCNIGINQARLANPEKKDASFLYTRTGGNFF